MKKLLFIPVIFFLSSVLLHAQNTVFVTKISWDFTNNTSEQVDGMMIQIIPPFKIEKGIANSQPVTLGASVTHSQKNWLPCNFRVELDNHGVVKFDVQKSGDRPHEMISYTFSYYFTRKGKQVGNIQTTKTGLTGSIPTQLGNDNKKQQENI